jgi:hypothetical protein
MLNAIILNAIVLNAIMLNAITLNTIFQGTSTVSGITINSSDTLDGIGHALLGKSLKAAPPAQKDALGPATASAGGADGKGTGLALRGKRESSIKFISEM